MPGKAKLFKCNYCGARFEHYSGDGKNVRCTECGTRGCERIEEEKDE